MVKPQSIVYELTVKNKLLMNAGKQYLWGSYLHGRCTGTTESELQTG
jgi:hypothetical protein